MAHSSSNSSALRCSDLPNPFTPMAFLPPSTASQVKLAGFLIVCSLAVIIWDQLHTLSDDYQLAFKKRIRWPTAVYLTSRIFTLIFLVIINVQILHTHIGHTGNCKSLLMMLCTCFLISRGSVALLMCFRVCAVYNMNRIVVLFFGFTCLGVIVGATTPFIALQTYSIHNEYCIIRVSQKFTLLLAVSITGCINDTLVLLAIVYKLGMADILRAPASKIYRFWKLPGRLQKFTRAFIQDSQIYYSIALIFNFATIVALFSSAPGSPFRFMIMFPDIVVVNIMACRAFRNVQFGRYSQVLFPTQRNLAQPDYNPGMDGEDSHRMNDMDVDMPTSSVEVFRRKELSWLPVTDPLRLGRQKPGTHVGGIKITKATESIYR